MKPVSVFLITIVLFCATQGTAQNVGIGTTSPTNKLSVNGSTDITGNLGIGTANPVGKLHIQSLGETGIVMNNCYILFIKILIKHP